MHQSDSGPYFERRYYLKHGTRLVHLDPGREKSRVLFALETAEIRKVAGSLEDAPLIFTGKWLEPTRIGTSAMKCKRQISSTMRRPYSSQFLEPIPDISTGRLGTNEHDHQNKNTIASRSQHDAPLFFSSTFVRFDYGVFGDFSSFSLSVAKILSFFPVLTRSGSSLFTTMFHGGAWSGQNSSALLPFSPTR